MNILNEIARIVSNIFFWGNCGLLVEIWFTGLYSFLKKNWRGTAQTHLTMIPAYIMGGLTFRYIHDNITVIPHSVFWNALCMSVLFYLPLCYGFELLYGLMTEKWLGVKLWDYGLSKMTPFGLINFKYAPAWFVLTIVFQVTVVYLSRIEHFLFG